MSDESAETPPVATRLSPDDRARLEPLLDALLDTLLSGRHAMVTDFGVAKALATEGG